MLKTFIDINLISLSSLNSQKYNEIKHKQIEDKGLNKIKFKLRLKCIITHQKSKKIKVVIQFVS